MTFYYKYPAKEKTVSKDEIFLSSARTFDGDAIKAFAI
jgi:hypothetical protein